MSTEPGRTKRSTTVTEIRVLHVTDPHLFADPESSLRGTVTHESLQLVLDHIDRAGWTADLVAMTGDLIQDDSRAAYERFRELLAPVELPVLCVPGNHDIRKLMRDALAQPPFHYCGTFELGNWLIAGIDSCISGDAGGHVADDELERLGELIDNTAAEHVLICLHHPPLDVGCRWLDRVGLRNGEAFLRYASSAGKVRAAIFGHVHQEFHAIRDTVTIIGTPSTCRQFEPGADDFAVDDKPPAYRRITLAADGTLDSELIWVTP